MNNPKVIELDPISVSLLQQNGYVRQCGAEVLAVDDKQTPGVDVYFDKNDVVRAIVFVTQDSVKGLSDSPMHIPASEVQDFMHAKGAAQRFLNGHDGLQLASGSF